MSLFGAVLRADLRIDGHNSDKEKEPLFSEFRDPK
jgi:hypothetical protein